MNRLPAVFLLTVSLGALPAAVTTPLGRLQANVERITRSVNADWGIYIKCVETGEQVMLNPDQQMDTMSVIKLPLLAEAFRQIEAGKFSLGDRVLVREEDKRPGTGTIRSLDSGVSLTIKDLLTMMIIVSDNTATDLMFAKVGGPAAVNALMDQYGMPKTRATGTAADWFRALRAAPSAAQFAREGKHPFGLTSAREIGGLLEKMESGTAVSKQASAQMMQMLRGQVYSSRLPRYVSGYAVPHKTGDFMPYIGNDVGVLESEKRHIVIAVLTAHHFGVGASLEDAIGRIAELVGNYFGER